MRWEVPRELLWALIFALIVTVVALWPLQYPYSQAPRVQSQEQTEDHVRGTNPPQHSPAAPENPSSQQQQHGGGEHGYEINILGVKPGELLLSVVTFMLWWATRNLVSGAERTAQQQLRAFVFITRRSKVSFDPTTGRLSVYVKLQNSGQTPAYDFTTWIDGDNFLFDALPFPGATRPITDRATASIVGPGQGVNLDSVNNPTDNSVVQAIRDGHLGLFIWGGSDYTDAFGKRWEFVFRMRISGPEDRTEGTAFVWSLHPHPIGYTEREIPEPN